MIAAPSGSKGSAFWTVKSRPFTLMLNSSLISPSAEYFATPGKQDIKPALLLPDLGEQAVEIAELGHVPRDAGYVPSYLLDRRIQLCRSAPGYEDVRPFTDVRRRDGRRCFIVDAPM